MLFITPPLHLSSPWHLLPRSEIHENTCAVANTVGRDVSNETVTIVFITASLRRTCLTETCSHHKFHFILCTVWRFLLILQRLHRSQECPVQRDTHQALGLKELHANPEKMVSLNPRLLQQVSSQRPSRKTCEWSAKTRAWPPEDKQVAHGQTARAE